MPSVAPISKSSVNVMDRSSRYDIVARVGMGHGGPTLESGPEPVLETTPLLLDTLFDGMLLLRRCPVEPRSYPVWCVALRTSCNARDRKILQEILPRMQWAVALANTSPIGSDSRYESSKFQNRLTQGPVRYLYFTFAPSWAP